METERQPEYVKDSQLQSLTKLLHEVQFRANMAMHDEEYDKAEDLLRECENLKKQIQELDPGSIEEGAKRLNRELHEQDKN